MEVLLIFNPIVRLLSYLVLILTFGNIIFLAHFSSSMSIKNITFCKNYIRSFSFIGMVSAFLSYMIFLANMSGDLREILDINIITVSFETLAVKSFLFNFFGYFFILVFFNKILNKFWYLGLFGIISVLFSFIIYGHSTKNGLITQILLIFHLIGISYWLGGLLPLFKMCKENHFDELKIVSKKFGKYAIFYIILLLVTGLTFSYLLLGGLDVLFSTAYGNVLLIKLCLVSFLLTLGSLNKFYYVPKLDRQGKQSIYKLKNSLRLEILIALIILFISSLLTTSLNLP